MSEKQAPDLQTEANDARLELYTAIKQAAEEVRLQEVVNATTVKGTVGTTLLALAQAWQALQSSDGN